MDKRLTAIVLKATDLRESDRSVRLFSVEEGVVNATVKGVRKPSAKLKFAAQPLALCNYELAEKAGRYTVTGASSIEDLYSLCLDPEKFSAACLIAEITEKSAQSIDSDKLFIVLLKSLKTLAYEEISPAVLTAKYIQKILSMSGFVAVPPKSDLQPDTPPKLLGFIAYKTLSELAEMKFEGKIALKALKQIAAVFEKTYETKLVSLSVFTGVASA